MVFLDQSYMGVEQSKYRITLHCFIHNFKQETIRRIKSGTNTLLQYKHIKICEYYLVINCNDVYPPFSSMAACCNQCRQLYKTLQCRLAIVKPGYTLCLCTQKFYFANPKKQINYYSKDILHR